jgi:alanine racemase
MDLITVDVTELDSSTLYEGAPVEVIGPTRTVDAVAADAGTIGYEVLTSLGHRFARRYRSAAPEPG